MKIYRSYLFLLLLAVPLAYPPPALAFSAARTWVSSSGNDGNTVSSCGYSTPCATFAAAIAVTNAGGEIDVEDSGYFGPVVISHAITIDGGGYTAAVDTQGAGASCGSFTAICITAGGSDTVTLRNLSLSVGASNVGIDFQSGQYLRVEHVSILGPTHMSSGITATAGQTSLNDIRIQNATESGGTGVVVQGSGVRLSISNSFLMNNTYGLAAVNGGVAQVENCVFMFNTTAVSTFTGEAASGGTVQLSNSTITDNATGLQTTGAGASLISFGNNAVFGNTINGNPTGATTQK